MSTSIILLCLVIIGAVAYVAARSRATALSGGRSSAMHSRSAYHGSYAAIWAVLPSLIVLFVWLAVSPGIVSSSVRGGFPDDVKAQPAVQQDLAYSMVATIARGMNLLTSDEVS